MTYSLSVLFPLPNEHTLLHLFDISVDNDLQWVKAHADEMAKAFTKRDDYCALYVQ